MSPSDLPLLMLPCFFAVAFLYSSVGHGGASGYLALMVLFGLQPEVMKQSSLLFNIFVSGLAFYQFRRGGHFRWNLFLPFIIASVPASFAGACITLDASVYKKILGILLLFPVIRLFLLPARTGGSVNTVPLAPALVIGAVIGFLSGMIGIGGGILLSPVILLMGWGTLKETAAVSALFIFVNSLSGISGLILKGASFDDHVLWLFPVVILGGLTGAYFGSGVFKPGTLRGLLALVLVIASVKLLSV